MMRRVRQGAMVGLVAMAWLFASGALGAPRIEVPVTRRVLHRYEHVRTLRGGPPNFRLPWAIAVADDGIIYSTWAASGLVVPMAAAEDSALPTSLWWNGSETAAGKLVSPTGLAIGSAGGIYVVDAIRSRVYIFDRYSGAYLRALGGGSGVDFRIPRDVAYTAGFFERPRLWVTDFGSHCVYRNHPDKWLDAMGELR